MVVGVVLVCIQVGCVEAGVVKLEGRCLEEGVVKVNAR